MYCYFAGARRAFSDDVRHQVWYGMVWYGMVWYGMVWYGTVWYGRLPFGMGLAPNLEGCRTVGWGVA